jgi:hypothetical protein
MNDPEPIVAVLGNGLGNQMSCIAGALEYAKTKCRLGRKVVIDAIGLWKGVNKHEDGQEFTAMRFWTGLAQVKEKSRDAVSEYVHEKFLPQHFFNAVWEYKRRKKSCAILYKGYSYHHFASMEILKETVLNHIIVPTLSESVHALTGLPNLDHCFFLHIRRGDYITKLNRLLFGVDLYSTYYNSALQHFAKQLKGGARILVCSDDILWCQQNLSSLYAQVPLYAWCYCKALRADDTLTLMASCALGGITSNSSLSWWGMVLGKFKSENSTDRVYVTPENFVRILWPFQSVESSQVALPRNVKTEQTGDVYMVDKALMVLTLTLALLLLVLPVKTWVFLALSL